MNCELLEFVYMSLFATNFNLGTTGYPKGVDVTHGNVVNLVCTSPGDLGVQPGTCVGSVLNISFDMAAWEIFCCLCNGGTLILRASCWEDALSQVGDTSIYHRGSSRPILTIVD